MLKKIVVISLPFILSACASPEYKAEPILSQNLSKSITIVKDDATREVFLESMREWCLDTAHKCTVVSDGTDPVSSELTLTYVSRWSWDFKTFIADAKIKAYRNSAKVGQVEFDAPNNTNTDKWGDDNKRIMAMMDILFGLQTIDEVQNKIKSGDI